MPRFSKVIAGVNHKDSWHPKRGAARFLCPWEKMDAESRAALPGVLRESLEKEGATLTGGTDPLCLNTVSPMKFKSPKFSGPVLYFIVLRCSR